MTIMNSYYLNLVFILITVFGLFQVSIAGYCSCINNNCNAGQCNYCPPCGQGFATSGSGFPTLTRGFPTSVQGFPLSGQGFPTSERGYPTYRRNYPPCSCLNYGTGPCSPCIRSKQSLTSSAYSILPRSPLARSYDKRQQYLYDYALPQLRKPAIVPQVMMSLIPPKIGSLLASLDSRCSGLGSLGPPNPKQRYVQYLPPSTCRSCPKSQYFQGCPCSCCSRCCY